MESNRDDMAPLDNEVVKQLLAIGEQHGAKFLPETKNDWPEIRFPKVKKTIDHQPHYMYIVFNENEFFVMWRTVSGEESIYEHCGEGRCDEDQLLGAINFDSSASVSRAFLILLATISGD